jgi:hypothetical protein
MRAPAMGEHVLAVILAVIKLLEVSTLDIGPLHAHALGLLAAILIFASRQ